MPDHDFQLHPPDGRLLGGRRALVAEIPLGRWGEVSDVAGAVAWVASDQAQYVVGATVFFDGGMALYPGFV